MINTNKLQIFKKWNKWIITKSIKDGNELRKIKRTNNNKSVKRVRIGTKKWGILKYLSTEFRLKSQRLFRPHCTCQWYLRSKIGVWQMPLFKFLRPEIWRRNLWFDRSKKLKYKVHHFWPKMLWMLVMQLWMQDGEEIGRASCRERV